MTMHEHDHGSGILHKKVLYYNLLGSTCISIDNIIIRQKNNNSKYKLRAFK